MTSTKTTKKLVVTSNSSKKIDKSTARTAAKRIFKKEYDQALVAEIKKAAKALAKKEA